MTLIDLGEVGHAADAPLAGPRPPRRAYGALVGLVLLLTGMADGRTRWRTALPTAHGVVLLAEVGGDIVVATLTSRPGRHPVETLVPESMVLAATDGRVRWRRPGLAVPTGDGGLLLRSLPSGGTPLAAVDPVAVRPGERRRTPCWTGPTGGWWPSWARGG